MDREGRGGFSCREVGNEVPCRSVSGLALVNNFPNELALIKPAHEKQEKTRKDDVDITLEAQLEDGSIPEANHVVFKNFYCKWGIHKLKMTEEEKALLVGGNYRLISETQPQSRQI